MAGTRFGIQAAADVAGAGYWHGVPPRAGGTGSMAGSTGSAQSLLPTSSAWHPTVVSLLVLIFLEMAAYAGLRYAFRKAHGG